MGIEPNEHYFQLQVRESKSLGNTSCYSGPVYPVKYLGRQLLRGD